MLAYIFFNAGDPCCRGGVYGRGDGVNETRDAGAGDGAGSSGAGHGWGDIFYHKIQGGDGKITPSPHFWEAMEC